MGNLWQSSSESLEGMIWNLKNVLWWSPFKIVSVDHVLFSRWPLHSNTVKQMMCLHFDQISNFRLSWALIWTLFIMIYDNSGAFSLLLRELILIFLNTRKKTNTIIYTNKYITFSKLHIDITIYLLPVCQYRYISAIM